MAIIMVYTEHAPRRQQFHVAPTIEQPNTAFSTTLSVDIQKPGYKKNTVLI